MKKHSLTLLVILLCHLYIKAQTAGDVLENGIPVKADHIILLQYNDKDNSIKYAATRSLHDNSNPPVMRTLPDSAILLIPQSSVALYLKPLNPLNAWYTEQAKEITDPINQAASVALGSIIEIIQSAQGENNQNQERQLMIEAYAQNKNKKYVDKNSVENDPCKELADDIVKDLDSITKQLQNDQKTAIVEVFTNLKSLSFEEQKSTELAIKEAKAKKSDIEKHFSLIESMLTTAKNKIDKYTKTEISTCLDKSQAFTNKYIFGLVWDQLNKVAIEQKKRLDNLQLAYQLVISADSTAAIGGGFDGLTWCIPLQEIPVNNGKILLYSLTIKFSGYKLSDKNEIVATESKDLKKRMIRFRKFQRFVPEVSVGIAYTFFSYNTYGTTSDSTGQQYVASATENLVRNINISTMINWNLYSYNSPINPLIQLGAGINAGIPTLLLGGGLRFSDNMNNRLRLTGGIAMTWIKELDKLKVGDKISGTDDIDKDLKYQFSWPPKPYIGVQYNF